MTESLPLIGWSRPQLSAWHRVGAHRVEGQRSLVVFGSCRKDGTARQSWAEPVQGLAPLAVPGSGGGGGGPGQNVEKPGK